jgi:hypothetical protein
MSKKKKAPKVGASKAVIILTILSVLGSMISGVSDMSWSKVAEASATGEFDKSSPKVIELMNGTDSKPGKLVEWKEDGIDTSEEGLMRISDMFFYVALLNIPVLLGVMLMFFKIKIGFEIYVVGQIAYMLLPIYYLGLNFYPNFRALTYGDIAVMLLFIVMWGIQRKMFSKNGNIKAS